MKKVTLKSNSERYIWHYLGTYRVSHIFFYTTILFEIHCLSNPLLPVLIFSSCGRLTVLLLRYYTHATANMVILTRSAARTGTVDLSYVQHTETPLCEYKKKLYKNKNYFYRQISILFFFAISMKTFIWWLRFIKNLGTVQLLSSLFCRSPKWEMERERPLSFFLSLFLSVCVSGGQAIIPTTRLLLCSLPQLLQSTSCEPPFEKLPFSLPPFALLQKGSLWRPKRSDWEQKREEKKVYFHPPPPPSFLSAGTSSGGRKRIVIERRKEKRGRRVQKDQILKRSVCSTLSLSLFCLYWSVYLCQKFHPAPPSAFT